MNKFVWFSQKGNAILKVIHKNMSEKIKKKKKPLTRKEAIRKSNKDFRSMARQLAKTMNAESGKAKK